MYRLLTSTIIIVIGLTLLMIACTGADELVYSESFEQGMTGWKTYQTKPPQAELSVVTGDAADGQRFLQAEIPSGPGLAGPQFALKNLQPGRAYLIMAQVRGQGQMMLLSGTGVRQVRSNKTLTDRWEQIQLSKVLHAGARSTTICFLIPGKPQQALFQIDNVTVTKLDVPPLKDVPVPPVRFEAENWISPDWRGMDEAASGQAGAADRYWFRTQLIPFPQTSQPVDICARVNAFSGDKLRVETCNGGSRQTLAEQVIKQDGWQWVRFTGFSAAEMGESFAIYQIRPERGREQTLLDSIVLTTEPELSEAELDALPAYQQRPFAAVGRAVSGPVIDGQGDDAAWQQATTLQPFLSGLEGAAPQAATEAQIMWDDDNLYVRFHCAEPLLDPVNNRVNDFRKRYTERDSDTWKDQFVVLILQPPGSDHLYDFFINANGAVNDARAPLAEPWGGRDTSYNPPIDLAAHIGDGFWEVEMAIPWSAIGGPPDVEPWRACLGRRRSAEPEASTWNATPAGGFHLPDNFGALRFVDIAQSLAVDLPLRLAPTDNQIQVTTRAEQLPVTVLLGTRALQEGPVRSQFKILRDQPAVQWTFDLAESGQIVFAASVLDGATLQPLALSSEMTRMVEVSRATLQIATEGKWQARVGEAVVASGSGDDIDVLLPLSEGANVVSITFESGSGAFAGEFQGVPLVSDESWVMAGAEIPDRFYEARLDDTELPRAQVLGESALPGAKLIGAEAGPVTVRKTLLWRFSRIWPKPVPCLYVAQNCPQHVSFPNPGMPGRNLDDFRLYVGVPAGFEVLGASSYYHQFLKDLAVYAAAKVGTRTLGEEEYLVWEVTADKPVPYRNQDFVLSQLDVYVRATQAPDRDGTPQIAYWLEAEQGAVIEAPQFVPVQVLPPLRGKQPQTIRWQLWPSFLFRVDDHDMRRAALEAARQAGINEIVSGDEPELCAEYGMRRVGDTHFWGWGSYKTLAKEHPEWAQVDFDGNRSETILSPAYWLAEAWPAYEDILRDYMLRFKPESLIWDIETNPWKGYFCSFDERSLREFAAFAGIDVAGLTPQVIKEQHSEKWLDFVGQRCAELCRKTKDAIHEILPGAQFLVYSGYQTHSTLELYSVDWARIAALDAVDVASCGYGRSKAALTATREALGDIPLITGDLLAPYRRTEDRPVNAYTPARLLRRLTDSTNGVLLYARHSFDGRCYWAIGEVSQLSADHEEIFLKGKLLDRWGELGEANIPDSAVLEYEGQHLVAFMNEGGKPRTYRFKLPETGFTNGIEYYSQQAVQPDQSIELELAPGAVAAYVLE